MRCESDATALPLLKILHWMSTLGTRDTEVIKCTTSDIHTQGCSIRWIQGSAHSG